MKIEVPGGVLAYEARGSGPTLLWLHAFPFDRRMWSEELTLLSDERRVIAVDLRGCGESPLWGAPSLDDLAEDVVHLLDALGVATATVGGLSLGGYVALAVAARHRARLAALILADTRAGADSEATRHARAETIRQVRAEGPNGYLDGVPGRLLSPDAPPGLRARVRALAGGGADTLTALTRAMAERPDRHDLLPTLDLPALVLCGSIDTVSPAIEMRAWAQSIPGAEYVELAGAGHLSNLEAPAAFGHAVVTFLRAHEL